MLGSLVTIALEGARLNALLVAVIELRLVDQLAVAPATVSELADRSGISERGCQAMADGMVALRLWRVQEGLYENTATAVALLARNGSAFVGDYHPAIFRAWLPMLSQLTEVVRTGLPLHDLKSAEGIHFWSILTPALAYSGAEASERAVQLLELQHGSPSVIDIGGGAGALYAKAILRSNPEARVTQIDWPEINALASRSLSSTEQPRFVTVDGDFHNVNFGVEAYDIAILSHIMHQESPETNAALIRKISQTLRPGGRLLISDWVVENGRVGPPASLIFNTTMLLLSPEGKSYEQSEIVRLLTDAGFANPNFHPASDFATFVIAHKQT